MKNGDVSMLVNDLNHKVLETFPHDLMLQKRKT